MPRVSGAALAFLGLLGVSCSLSFCLSTVPAHGDDDLSSSRHGDAVVEGIVQSVSRSDDSVTLSGSDGHHYIVDAYTAEVLLRDSRRPGELADIARGMRLEVTGRLVGRSMVEAARLRVLPEFRGTLAALNAPQVSVPQITPPFAPPHAAALPSEPAPAPAQPQLTLDGLVRDVDAAHHQVVILGDDDKRYTLNLQGTDIILRGTERAGQFEDLTRGMRVHLIGAVLPSGVVEADRLRILPAIEAPAPPPAPIAPVVEDMSVYTGILIDARGLPRMSRSPAPAIYGPAPDQNLLYPDRSHVPTPDEVQEESIVRYYHSETDGESGIGGAHPLILTAQAVLGPAEDAVQLTAEDAARFQALDKRLRFTRSWKVGFLIPANQ